MAKIVISQPEFQILTT